MDISSKRSMMINGCLFQEASPERDVCVNGSLVTGSIKEVKLSIGGTSHDTTVDISSVSGGNGRYYVVTLAATAPASAVVGDALWDEAATTPKKFQIIYISGTTLWVRDSEDNGVAPSNAGSSQAYIKRYYNSSTSIDDWETDLADTNVHPKGCYALGEMYNDQTWSSSFVVFSSTNPGVVAVRAANSDRHDGTYGSGVSLTRTGAGVSLFTSSRKDVYISDLCMKLTGASGYASGPCVTMSGTTVNVYAFRNVLEGESGIDRVSASSNFALNFSANTACEGYAWDNIVYNWAVGRTTDMYGMGVYAHYGTHRLWNNTFFNCERGMMYNAATTSSVCKNNISVMCKNYDFLLKAGTTYNNNLSSDATSTGTGAVTGVHSDDLFVSTASGFEDLHLKEGAPAIGAAADLGIGENLVFGQRYDIHKSDRHRFTATTWDIGAHQYEITASIGAGTGNNRDYEGSTAIADWVDDWTDTDIYGFGGARVKGLMYNDAAFDEGNIQLSEPTYPLSYKTLTVPTSERHDGTEGSGVRVVPNSANANFTTVASANIELSWFEQDLVNKSLTAQTLLCNAGGGITDILYDGLLVHDCYRNGSFVRSILGRNSIKLRNSIFYNIVQQSTGAGVDAYVLSSTVEEIFNCTCALISNAGSSGTTYGWLIEDNASYSMKNNISMDVTGPTGAVCYSPSTFSNAAVSHNMSSDTTAYGTGSLTSQVTSNQFVSTASGFEDLHIKSGSNAIGAGTDLGFDGTLEIDIDGNDRDWDGSPWDVGAHQFVPDNGATSADWTQKYNRKCALSIQSSQVAVDWEGYTVAITEDCLPEEMFDSDGSYPAQANGGDVRFSSDENGLFPLPAHIARFSTDPTPANGRALIFVNTDIDAGTDVDVYVWYNSTDTKTQPDVDHEYGKYNSYSSWLRAVYHFEDASVADAALIDEATGRFLSSDISGSGAASTTGPLGNELNLSGSQFVDVNGQVHSGYTTKLTLTSFFNSNDVTKVNSLFGYWLNTGATQRYKWYQDTNAKIKFTLSNDGGTPAIVAASTFLVDSTDYHLGVTFNAGTVTHYLNGSSDGSGSTDAYLVSVSGNDAIGWVNGNDATANKTDGNLDEFWAWERVLSANEMTTLYNNQSSPATFVIEGTPVSVAPVSETPVSCDGTTNIASSWSADLVELIALSGVSSVNSIWSADLVESVHLDGTAIIDSIWSGSLEETYSLDGSVTISSLWSGDVLEKLSLAGTSSILSSWIGPSPVTVSIGIIASHKQQGVQHPISSPVGYYRLGGSAVRNFRRQGYPQVKQQFIAFPIAAEEVAVGVDGTAAISSIWSSDLVEFFDLSGVVVIASVWSSDVIEYITLNGTATATSLWSADIVESIKSVGTADISSLWSADIQETYNLDGTTTVTSIWVAGLTENYEIDGTADISSLWSADVLESIKIDGTSSISSDWFAGTVVSVALTGTSSIDSLWNSDILEAIKLGGISTINSLWSAGILEAIKLDGISTINSLWSADILEDFNLTGTSDISSEWTAGTVLSVPVDGTSTILSIWSSDLLETLSIVGSTNIQSIWTAELLESLSVQGIVNIQSVWSSDLEEFISLDGNITITSEWSSESVLPVALSGTSDILSLWESDFVSLFNLSGFVPIESVWSAGIFEAISLSGNADILSLWFASLEEIVAIQGTAVILSYWVYDTSAIYTAITVAAPCRQFSVKAPYRSFSVNAPRRMSSMSHYQCSVSMPPIVKQEWEEFNIGGDMTNWLSSDDTVASVDDVVIQDNDESNSLTVGTGFVSGLKGVKFGITGGKSDRDYRVEVRFTTTNGHKLAADFPVYVRG